MTAFEDLLNRSQNALKSTAPIFRYDERGCLDLFGTGIFFRHESQHFVLSGAHVLAELRKGPLRIGGESQAILVTGSFFHTGPVGEVTFDNDSFDVAFAPLSQEQVAGLDGTVFLGASDVDPAEPPTHGARYYAVGFVASDYKSVGPTQPLEAICTAVMVVPAPPERYQERGVGEGSHLLLSFDRLKTHSAEGQAATPKIYGMSGCGVWRVGASSARDKLDALLIEHHQQDGKFIVATRVETVLPGLASYVAGELKVQRGAV